MHSLNGVEVLDVREAATYVGRTAETVRCWVWSGRVPASRRGNRLLIARRDLDAAFFGEPSPYPVSLREWAASTPRRSDGSAGSAAALVAEDRWSDDHGR